MKALTIVLIITILQGCGTIGRAVSDKPTTELYRGTKLDAKFIKAAVKGCSGDPGCGISHPLINGPIAIFSIFSVPFDLVADTVFIPLDLHAISKK